MASLRQADILKNRIGPIYEWFGIRASHPDGSGSSTGQLRESRFRMALMPTYLTQAREHAACGKRAKGGESPLLLSDKYVVWTLRSSQPNLYAGSIPEKML